MALLTIGAFARATGLSPKALRLYDELGLLPPAAVDGGSGYRFYHPAQAERARLIAWLRRLGMPLARIGEVCDAEPREAAAQVAAYWHRVRAETVERGRLAACLVDHLSGRGDAMTDTTDAPRLRYAARSEPGLGRTSNEDTAYAGSRLLAVADGMRGEGGARASAAAVAALAPLEAAEPGDDPLAALAAAVRDADRAVREVARHSAADVVTTLTAMLCDGSRLALVHVGDTRAYRLREGELAQVTHDHTWVQTLVDQGRLTPEEAAAHPRRALLARALTGDGGGEPDLSLHDAVPGDRYVLCSDGLSAVVPTPALRGVLRAADSPEQALDDLVALAYAHGAPDNIACVVADVEPAR